MRGYTVTVKAGSFSQLSVVGNFIALTRPQDAEVRIRAFSTGDASQQVDDDIVLIAGQHVIVTGEYGYLQVYNDSAVDVAVELVLGKGVFHDNRTTGSVSIASNKSFEGLQPVVFDVTGGVLLPARAGRAMLVVYADADNQDPIVIGSIDGTAGIPLLAGGIAEIPVASGLAVYGTAGDIVYLAELM